MTIQQHASFDSSAAELNATSKLVKAWESKNAKNAAKAGGISLMALSLAACGGSSTPDAGNGGGSGGGTPDAGQAFVLKTTADIITGGSGDDTVSGTSGSIDGDTINAGAGDDTLSITVSNADDDNASFAATGLELLQIRGTGNGAGVVDLDLGDVAGLETVEFRRMAEDVTVTNLQDLDTALKISDTANANSNVIVNFDAAQVSGTSDTASLTVDNVTIGADFTVNGVETIAVTVVGTDNDIDIDGDDLETVTVSGSGDISIDVDASVTTFNASTATGDVTMVAAAAADVTATGGAGDDTFTMGTTLTAADTIVGGDGSDTLGVTGAGAAVMPASAAVTGVETLSITTGGADTYDASIVSFDSVNVTVAANAHTIAMTNLTTETVSVENGSAAGAADDDVADINLALSDATGDEDSITLNLTNNDADNEMAITTMDFGVSNVETVNLVFGRTADIDDASEFNIADINSAHDTLNLSGTADVTIDAKDSAATITSTVVGDVTLTVGAVDAVVTMGAGDDAVIFAGTLDTDDNVTGGDGDDTVTATLGAGVTAATLSGVETVSFVFGDGNETFSGANATGLETVVIADASDDNVSLSALGASVTTVQLASDNSNNNSTNTIDYAANTDTAHSVVIGEVDEGADAITSGNVIVTDNEGTLTVTDTADATVNIISNLTANDATALVITTTDATLELDAGGEGAGNLSATSALSAIITSGADLLVDGTTDLSAATSITYAAGAGTQTYTGASDITDATSVIITAESDVTFTGDVTGTGDITSFNITADDAVVDFTGTTDALDVVNLVSMVGNAVDGGTITIDELIISGTDSDTDNINLTLDFSATGEDASDNGSTVTVSNVRAGAAATVDEITLASDADGTMTLILNDNDVTVTSIDASGSLGDLTFTSTDTAVGNDITFGAGTNSITTEADVSDTITLAVEAGTDTFNIAAVSGEAEDVVSNFEAGNDGDIISIDVSAVDVGGDGSGIVNQTGTDLSAILTVIIETDADGTLDATDTTNIIALTNTFANVAAVGDALGENLTVAAGVADDDDILVLWSDGANSYLSALAADWNSTAAGATRTTEEENLIQFSGITDVTELTADNFAFI